MNLSISFFIVLAIFGLKTTALTSPWNCYAVTNKNIDGRQGVPIRDDTPYCDGYISTNKAVYISTYNCNCNSVNVALEINYAFKPTEYAVIGPSQTARLFPWTNGNMRVFASNNCSNQIKCFFKVEYY